jgi:hypothetical protein
MQIHSPVRVLEPATASFYRKCLQLLSQAQIPFLIGGGYAFFRYTGVARHTKDLDIFIRERDLTDILRVLENAGLRTERTFSHWLSKAFAEHGFIDIIHNSGNGIAKVDDEWFAHSQEDLLFDVAVRLCPPEEMIWSKGFIVERERYDGADIAHLLRGCGQRLNWTRLLTRFNSHWHVLLSHLLLFRFIYPDEATLTPGWVEDRLLENLQRERSQPSGPTRLCRGTLLSREQYLTDIEQWGYRDARLPPYGSLTPEQLEQWTAGIDWHKN